MIFRFIKRIFKFLLAYIVFSLFLLFLVPLTISFFKTRAIVPNSLLTIRIESPLTEKENASFIKFKPELSLQKMRRVLYSALKNKNIKGVIFDVYSDSIGGYAQIEELRRIVQKFKQNKKSIYFYTNTFGEACNASSMYYLATACDRIYMQHGGYLSFMGMGVETFFIKDALDRWNLNFDVFKQKEYKGFLDFALYNDYSPEVKQNITRLLVDIFSEVKKNVANDRHKTLDDMALLLKNAPLSDKDSYKDGYVDGLLYRHEFYDLFKKYNLVKFEHYAVKDQKQNPKKKVAVFYCEGAVVKYKPGLMGENTFNDKHFAKAIDKILDKKYDGIILRISTRGGSETATEGMYGALLKAKSKGLKIVTSMGDYAASAGYFISCASDKIVAEPLTITGSIGVIRGKLNTKRFWENLGVHWRDIKEGENASIFSTSQDLTLDQKVALEKDTKASYENFVSIVSKARGKSVHEVDMIAKGQVWSGRIAKAFGLVDELGGLEVAEKNMKLLLGTESVEFVDIKDTDFYDFIQQMMGETSGYFLSSCINYCQNQFYGMPKIN